MSLETRPQSHDERAQVVGAIELWRATPGVSPEDVGIETRVFSAVRVAYVDARAAYEAAIAASLAASDAADLGAKRFDKAWREWVASVRDADGKSLASELTALLGGMAPSKVSRRSCREAHSRASRLMELVRGRAALQGDAAKLAALDASLATLGPLISADEAATREKVARGAALKSATAAFDRAYSKLVRAMRGILGDEATFTILPRFARSDRPAAPSGGGTPS